MCHCDDYLYCLCFIKTTTMTTKTTFKLEYLELSNKVFAIVF